jgi:ABC-type lipoprotein export system ATPase subunit
MVLTPINENNDVRDRIVSLSRPQQPNVYTVDALYWINPIIMHNIKCMLVSVSGSGKSQLLLVLVLVHI